MYLATLLFTIAYRPINCMSVSSANYTISLICSACTPSFLVTPMIPSTINTTLGFVNNVSSVIIVSLMCACLKCISWKCCLRNSSYLKVISSSILMILSILWAGIFLLFDPGFYYVLVSLRFSCIFLVYFVKES